MQGLWQSYVEQGIPETAAQVMVNAKRTSTQKQYDSYLKAWFDFCAQHQRDPFELDVPFGISFLEQLRHNVGYSALNTARSALSSILIPRDNVPFGQNRLVKLFMRGVYNIKPPQPRYVLTWDPQQVLNLLKTWNSPDTIDLKLLTFKVVVLVLLVTGQRLQTVSLLSIDHMDIAKDSKRITFTIYDFMKQSRPGYKNPQIVLKSFSDVDICVVTYMLAYIRRTRSVRTSPTLFISFKKPFNTVSKATLARWVKCVMISSGIDVSIFKPHSIRGASTSAALRGGAPVEDILASAGWTNNNVFAKYYQRSVQENNFDVAVLQNK